MDQLGGKVAVVTGAASGIGRATAGAFASEGMKVVLADIDEAAVEIDERIDGIRQQDAPGGGFLPV